MNKIDHDPVTNDSIYLNQVLEIESIYHSAPVGLCIFDRELQFIRLNQRFADMNGVPIEEHFGRTPREVVPDLNEQAENALRQILITGETLNLEIAGETPAHPGDRRYYDETWMPIKGPNGNIVGISVVAIDVTSRRNALDSLRRSNEQKTKFISLLSHELRNPLASISIALSMLDDLDTENSRKAVEVVKRQTSHLSRLVDDLLDVTRITNNCIDLQKKHLEINQLVRQSVIDHEIQYMSKGIHLETELDTEPCFVYADPARIYQVIGNLLHNSLKFTETGDTVRVRVYADKDCSEAVLEVSDTGHGIPAEILTEIFAPFFQADQSLDRQKGGIGLGLAIVKGIVEMHGGSVDVYSEGPSKGSSFTIRLPLSNHKESEIREKSQHSEYDSDALKILVIEDNPDLLEIMCDLLDALGHSTISASDGQIGIHKSKEAKPEVILCDIGLPGINGYDVAERINRDIELKGIYMIALSGYAQENDIQRAKEAGFQRHIAKPVSLDILKKALVEASIYINSL